MYCTNVNKTFQDGIEGGERPGLLAGEKVGVELLRSVGDIFDKTCLETYVGFLVSDQMLTGLYRTALNEGHPLLGKR